MLSSAFRLAVDINDYDLFVDLYHAATKKKNFDLADAAMIKAQRVFAEEAADSLSEDEGSEGDLPPPPPPPPPATTTDTAPVMAAISDVMSRQQPVQQQHHHHTKPFKPIDPSVLLASAELGPIGAAFSNLTIGDRPNLSGFQPHSIESHLSFAPQMDATFMPTTAAKRVTTSEYQVLVLYLFLCNMYVTMQKSCSHEVKVNKLYDL